MKKISFSILALLALSFWWACDKEVASGLEIEPYTYASLDLDGGDWKPVLLSNAAQIAVPAATLSGSPEYAAELASLKTQRANLTDAQKEAVKFWGANTIARWTTIACDLAAKYNLPPAPNADGTYSTPSAANPATYPYFPFANPPYAARAYAYFSGALYDALIVCWKAKKDNNRLAPYRYDNNIEPLLTPNDLPSYPSEDAVAAAVAQDILSAFFPVEKDNIAAMAAEAKSSRLWAGANVQSDIDAGDAIGRAVAQVFINRSKTDGMKNAIGNQALWDSLYQATTSRGDVAWLSQDAPSRPPMLPFFGNVKPWQIPSAAALRPGPPPAVGSPALEKDLEELRALQKGGLTAEQRRIAAFWADGPSTYTPPGHWNRTANELIVKYRLNPLRSARVLAYVNMAMCDAGIVCWHTKYYYFNPRPSQVDPSIKTFIGLPNFPAYTSGHSTFSGAAAAVLGHLFPGEATEMDRQAIEASESRIYGCIHYRTDCEVGLINGKAVGQYCIDRAKTDGGE
jgi:hypothetical protein